MQHHHKETPYRRTIRLPVYNYASAGMYFITICTQNRTCLFGEIMNGVMQINKYGQIVAEEWLKTAKMRPQIKLREFVVMPNHFHGIIHIVDSLTPHDETEQSTASTKPSTPSIGILLSGFKSAVTARIKAKDPIKKGTVWQRNYYEHIIRDDADYLRLAEYIKANPAQWHKDRFYQESL